jgi:hypothetical protein
VADVKWEERFRVPRGWDVEMMENEESTLSEGHTIEEEAEMRRQKPTKKDWENANALLDRIAKEKGEPTEAELIAAQREKLRRLGEKIDAIRAMKLRS